MKKNMKICAVICELNPLHNGHEYIFRKAKEQSGADYLVAIMSGNFVQRAEPAVMDENTRAEVALNCGADMVLELPIVYSVASADKFAGGAIKIVNTLPCVSHLVMGAEDNAQLLERAAEIQAKECDEFKNALRQLLRDGMPYAKALTHATAEIACPENKNEYLSMLNKPNNILAVAYKKALISSKSKVKFLPIPRIGGEISVNFKGEYSSASAIRASIGSDVDVSVSMPKYSYDTLARELSSRPVSKEKFDALALFALRNASLGEIAETPDCAEGFEHKIKELAIKTASYDEFLSAVPTSRFTKGRIMRICLQT
ncbi:MAG: nucleotidyltransferase family protein, partial [Clostridia bacterium]|nr:nucleotidyltransferase family protein [Clostridia bacterium]